MSLQALLRGEETPVSYVVRSPKDFSGRFYSAPGVPVHDIRPIQNMPLLRLGFEEAANTKLTDHELLNVAKEHFDPIIRQEVIKETARLHVKDIRYRVQPKNEERMRAKEQDPDFCGAAGHIDFSACMVFAGDVNTFTKLTNHHLPAEHSSVARLLVKAPHPDDTTKYPANLVNVVTTSIVGGVSVPWVNERQIGMDGWQSYYDETHNQMSVQRRLTTAFDNVRAFNPKAQKIIGRMDKAAKRGVPRANEEMAEKTGVDKLLQTRSYFLINIDGEDRAFTVARDRMNSQFCFFANPETGFYQTDNALLSMLDKAVPISRESFLTFSMVAVPLPNLSKVGCLPGTDRKLRAA